MNELYIEEDVLCVISMGPANEWMWTPPPSSVVDTGVMAWSDLCIGILFAFISMFVDGKQYLNN